MAVFFRTLLFLLLFLSILSIERVLGLPFISLVLASNFLAPTDRIVKTVGILLTGICIAAAYFVPIWLGVAIVGCLVFVLEERLIIFQRETLTYFFAVTFAVLVVGIASHYPVLPSNVIYHFILAVISLFIIRSWLMRRTDKWKIV